MTMLDKCIVYFGHGGSFLRSSRRQTSCLPPGLHSETDLEYNLNHYVVPSIRAMSLRVETRQSSLVGVWWKRVVQLDKFSRKWLSVGGE